MGHGGAQPPRGSATHQTAFILPDLFWFGFVSFWFLFVFPNCKEGQTDPSLLLPYPLHGLRTSVSEHIHVISGSTVTTRPSDVLSVSGGRSL